MTAKRSIHRPSKVEQTLSTLPTSPEPNPTKPARNWPLGSPTELVGRPGILVVGAAARAKCHGVDGIYGGRWTDPYSSSPIIRRARPMIQRPPSSPSLNRRSRQPVMPPKGRTSRFRGERRAPSAWTLDSSTRSSSTSRRSSSGRGAALWQPAAPRVDLENVVLEKSGDGIDLRFSVRR